MQIETTPQEFEGVAYTLLSYFPHLKKTTMLNVIDCKKDSAEYLSAQVLKCTMRDVEKILQKKVDSEFQKKSKIKLSEAQGIILFRTLIGMGVSTNDVYGYTVMQNWIEQLHHQIIK